jgi:hypothetical protein
MGYNARHSDEIGYALGGGRVYQFNTSTSVADPGTGKMLLNNANPESATTIVFSDTDFLGFFTSTGELQTNYVHAVIVVTPADSRSNDYWIYRTGSGITGGAGWQGFTSISVIASTGATAPANNSRVFVRFLEKSILGQYSQIQNALPIDDVDPILFDTGDGTSLLRIDVGAIATGTTRVLTYPNQDIDLTPDTGDFLSPAGHNGTIERYIPVGAMQPSVTAGCAALSNYETTAIRPDISHRAFDGTTREYAQFSIAMPERWNLGTITFQPKWTGIAAGAGTVIWALQAVHVPDDGTIDVAYGTAQTSTDTFTVAEDLLDGPESSAITVGGTPASGGMVFFQVYRDTAADTRTVDANLLGIKLIITANATNDD